MSEIHDVRLAFGQRGQVWDLTVEYTGGSTVNYIHRPPDGAVTMRFERGEKVEERVEVARDWGAPFTVFGYRVTVANAPELRPATLHLRIEPPPS